MFLFVGELVGRQGRKSRPQMIHIKPQEALPEGPGPASVLPVEETLSKTWK